MHGKEHPRPDPGQWQDRAACRGMDPATFVVNPGQRQKRRIAAAKAVCARCEVTAECLAEGLAFDADRHASDRAGMTPTERRAWAGRQARKGAT